MISSCCETARELNAMVVFKLRDSQATRRAMGPEPFELTKGFFDLVPGAFPYLSPLTAFGQAAPLNLEYRKAGGVCRSHTIF